MSVGTPRPGRERETPTCAITRFALSTVGAANSRQPQSLITSSLTAVTAICSGIETTGNRSASVATIERLQLTTAASATDPKGSRRVEVRRKSDWQARLLELIETRRSRPFKWGTYDCCLWPADAVLAMTGHDPAAAWRGTYRTARGARSALAMVGGLEGAGALCGAEIPPLCAQVGDVGIVSSTGERDAGAVCIGEHWLVVTRTGLGLVELTQSPRAWRVGAT